MSVHQPTTADANCNNFLPRHLIAAKNTSIESQKQRLHFMLVGFLIAPPIAEFKAMRAEATQNYNNRHTPHKHILAGNQST
jgi:hypothetical protein